jgi:hypothetical protein
MALVYDLLTANLTIDADPSPAEDRFNRLVQLNFLLREEFFFRHNLVSAQLCEVPAFFAG